MEEFNNPKINFRILDIIEGVKQLDKEFVDLASSTLGGKVIECNDEFFAEAFNLLKPQEPIREWGRYTERGAWMDGWETKRHSPSYDWVVIKLGFEGYLTGFDINTAHFVGNHAPLADVEACYSPHKDPIYGDDTNWHKVLTKVNLGPSSQHFFGIQKTSVKFTHVKLNIYPDGGVARFRVYGVVSAKWPIDPSTPIDLAYVGNEGRVIFHSDQHFGKSDNLLLPGRGKDMSDGWETKRSRQPNHKDWVIIKLGAPGYLEKAEIDTAFFKGNYPDSVLLEGCFCDKDLSLENIESNQWVTLLERNKLGPHKQHYFELKEKNKKFSHVKMTIFPDGGVKRLRIIGRRELPKNATDNVAQSATRTSLTRITATPLTYASYSPYGHIIQSFPEHSSASQNCISVSHSIKVTPANQGTARKYNNIAPVINFRQSDFQSQSSNSDNSTSNKTHIIAKAEPNLSLFKCSPAKSLPFILRLMEKHPYSSQMFVPLNNGKVKGYLVVVCLSNDEGDRPDLSTLNAFVVSSTQGISYHPGIWHHPIIALEETTDFVCLTHESGVADEDCEEFEFEEKDCVLIDVPGFNC
ncbi:unnamed protein product [Rhizophagus irregularis]|nr:unnamed protein product [Rhizophagus irregularis]CAB4409658.1 unnamed protein product [Rhizophagus irregularis]